MNSKQDSSGSDNKLTSSYCDHKKTKKKQKNQQNIPNVQNITHHKSTLETFNYKRTTKI